MEGRRTSGGGEEGVEGAEECCWLIEEGSLGVVESKGMLVDVSVGGRVDPAKSIIVDGSIDEAEGLTTQGI